MSRLSSPHTKMIMMMMMIMMIESVYYKRVNNHTGRNSTMTMTRQKGSLRVRRLSPPQWCLKFNRGPQTEYDDDDDDDDDDDTT